MSAPSPFTRAELDYIAAVEARRERLWERGSCGVLVVLAIALFVVAAIHIGRQLLDVAAVVAVLSGAVAS